MVNCGFFGGSCHPGPSTSDEEPMSIITISSGSYSHGKRVAEKVARKLGYECISRENIVPASDGYGVPQVDLFRAANDEPSVLGRMAYGKERYVALFRKALLDRLNGDNVVYQGFFGHFFVQGISHVLKLGIIAGLNQRVTEEINRKGISAARTRRNLESDDTAHHCWCHDIYGIDTTDSRLYDLVIPMHSMSVDDTAEIISQAASKSCFQPTPDSRYAMQMLYLAAVVQMTLMEETPFARVGIEKMDIVVTTKGGWDEGRKILTRVGHIIEREKVAAGLKVRLSRRWKAPFIGEGITAPGSAFN
jgi:cytidylate kinase